MTLATAAVLAASGEIYLGAFMVILFLAVIVGYYTRRGSDINQHPQGRSRSEAPGVGEGSSAIAGSQDGERDPLDTHGTR